jgi:hypothetical protein
MYNVVITLVRIFSVIFFLNHYIDPQDYFVFVPREYYEPAILKEDVYTPCIAGEVLPYCRHYSYPDLPAHPRVYSSQSSRPGGGPDVYSWSDNMDVLAELGTSKLASLARWQPELVYPVQVNTPGKHVLAVVFFTPGQLNPNATAEIGVNVEGDRKSIIRNSLKLLAFIMLKEVFYFCRFYLNQTVI